MARWIGGFILGLLGSLPWVATILLFVLDRIIGLPGTMGDAATWWNEWLPTIRAWALAVETEPAAWVASLVALLLAVWLFLPSIKVRLRINRGNPVEIVYADRRPFHGRAMEEFVDKGSFEYDYYFLGIRNPTRDKVARNVRVRVIAAGKEPMPQETNLFFTEWFHRDCRGLPASVELAPGEIRYCQFIFQSVNQSINCGVKIGGGNFGISPDWPLTVKVAAFGEEGTDIAEFTMSPKKDSLPTLRARRNISP